MSACAMHVFERRDCDVDETDLEAEAVYKAPV
jgi:hypothetical protein